MHLNFDPELDLLLERTTDISKEEIFEAWTTPELITIWFTPAPWRTPACDLELFPGGKFRTLMEGPNGESFDGTSCVVEVIPNERFVWSSALGPGFRPKEATGTPFVFTAAISVEDFEGGAKYQAHVMHGTPEAKKAHEEMGFMVGWGQAFDQLVAMVKARS